MSKPGSFALTVLLVATLTFLLVLVLTSTGRISVIDLTTGHPI